MVTVVHAKSSLLVTEDITTQPVASYQAGNLVPKEKGVTDMGGPSNCPAFGTLANANPT